MAEHPHHSHHRVPHKPLTSAMTYLNTLPKKQSLVLAVGCLVLLLTFVTLQNRYRQGQLNNEAAEPAAPPITNQATVTFLTEGAGEESRQTATSNTVTTTIGKDDSGDKGGKSVKLKLKLPNRKTGQADHDDIKIDLKDKSSGQTKSFTASSTSDGSVTITDSSIKAGTTYEVKITPAGFRAKTIEIANVDSTTIPEPQFCLDTDTLPKLGQLVSFYIKKSTSNPSLQKAFSKGPPDIAALGLGVSCYRNPR